MGEDLRAVISIGGFSGNIDVVSMGYRRQSVAILGSEVQENLALRMRARHGHELHRSVEPHGFVPQGSEVTQIPAGSTTKIKDGIRRVSFDRVEECCVVLVDIVI